MKAALAFVALAACTGQIGEDMPAGDENQQMFASTVDPMLRGKCIGCHEGAGAGPAFLGAAGADDDYDALLANGRVVGGFQAASALILTKGSHSGVQWWSADQMSTITAWLNAEAVNHTTGGTSDAMATWAGCMTIENWNASKMGMWAQKQTDQGATCSGCHADGEYGFHVNPTSDVMFAQQRTSVGIASFFQLSATGDVTPALDKLRSKISGANLHPSAAVDDQYVDYLKRFHQLTRAMLEAGLCDPPGYKDLTTPPPGP